MLQTFVRFLQASSNYICNSTALYNFFLSNIGYHTYRQAVHDDAHNDFLEKLRSRRETGPSAVPSTALLSTLSRTVSELIALAHIVACFKSLPALNISVLDVRPFTHGWWTLTKGVLCYWCPLYNVPLSKDHPPYKQSARQSYNPSACILCLHLDACRFSFNLQSAH